MKRGRLRDRSCSREKRTPDAGFRPRNATEHTTGLRRLGALELKFRYSQLRIDGDAFPRLANPATAPQSAKEKAIGMSWYLNRYVKLDTYYEHTGFGVSLSTANPLHSENVLMNRIQLAFCSTSPRTAKRYRPSVL